MTTIAPARPAAATVDTVRRAGTVRAAVSRGISGLSARDRTGVWRGLDVDVARAVAAAVLGDPEAVTWLPTDPAVRLERLAAGEADLVACNLTWTLGREAAPPVLFAAINCYDGEGFLVRTADGIDTPDRLAGLPVAVQAGTTSPSNLEAWFAGRGLAPVRPIAYPTPARALDGYVSGGCAAYVLDRIALAGARAGLGDPSAHQVLEAAISQEPMALAVRDDDPDWFRICRWTVGFLTAAEHAADQAPPGSRGRAAAAAARAAGAHGPALGLDERWAARILDAVGHYGDVYHRNLGAGSPLGVPRGLNELWTRGGLHYALPLH